jgi:hypothetical protein
MALVDSDCVKTCNFALSITAVWRSMSARSGAVTFAPMTGRHATNQSSGEHPYRLATSSQVIPAAKRKPSK